ncbi:MAG: hypothetical protein JWO42_3062 [Chloroflexi bacterium]|nr:hypothetical protein [Chloroflexota bacterium]
MSFVAPGALAFAALGLLIVAQYVLKLRRPVRVVPSTLLWQRAIVDRRANTPWQRLRAEPLMLLQLAALAVVVLALMRPYVLRAGSIGTNAVIIIDASLSSQTIELGRSRFDREIASARGLVDGLPPGKTMSLVRLDGHPRLLIAGSSDAGALNAVLRGQQPGYEAPDTRTALSLAFGLASQSSGGRANVIVLRSASTTLPAKIAGSRLVDQPFGNNRAANLALDALAAANQVDGSIDAVYKVRNTGDTSLASDVEIRAGGRLQAIDHVAVPAGGYVLRSASFLAGHPSTVEARLTFNDSLTQDNSAWAVVPRPGQRKVAVFTGGNVFLSAALAGIPGLSVQLMSAAAYGPDRIQGADLVIFDGNVPPVLPATNLLLIHPNHDIAGMRIGGTRSVGPLMAGDDPAGLLRYVTPGNIHVFKAQTASVPEWGHVALRDHRGPLIVEGEVGSPAGRAHQRIVLLNFDLGQSDLPLGIDFPILVSNMLEWLAPSSSINNAAVRPGEPVHITLPSGITAATVSAPDGQNTQLLPASADTRGGTITFRETAVPGAYAILEQAGAVRHSVYFAVNPQISLVSQSGSSSPAQSEQAIASPANAGQVPVELTEAVALAAIALLAAEWFLAMRIR